LKEATTQLGLVAKIDEVENYLQEAIAFYYAPYDLRFLYPLLIVDIPAPGLELWEKFKDQLLADHTAPFATADQAYLEVLRDIKRLLTPCSSKLTDFTLPDSDKE